MGGVSLKLVGPWPAWNDQAQRGTMHNIEGDEPTRPVLILPVPDEPTLQGAQQEGRRLLTLRHPQILPLLRVMAVAGRPCTIHPFDNQLSMERLRRELNVAGQSLPLRVVLDLAVGVADTLGTAWNDAPAGAVGSILHPGVWPGLLLLDDHGGMQVAGFRALPRQALPPTRPGYLAPEGLMGPSALVYGCGALLVDLLVGEPPAPSSLAPDRQAALIRRSLIRVLARSGARVPERLVEIIQTCLTVDPAERPSLPRLSIQLSALATEQPGPGLAEWIRAVVDPLRERLARSAPSREAPPVRFTPAPFRDADPGLAPTTEGGTISRRASADSVTEHQTEEVTGRLQQTSSAQAAAAVQRPEPATAEAVGAIAIGGDVEVPSSALDSEEIQALRPRSHAPLLAALVALALVVGLSAWLRPWQDTGPAVEEVAVPTLPAELEPLEVEEIGAPLPEEAPAPASIPEPEPAPAPEPALATSVRRAPAPEPEPSPARIAPEPAPVDPDSPQRVVIIGGTSTQRTPPPPPPPAPPPYTLRFSASSSAIQSMDVACHGGRVGSGLSVTITGAVAGPCKVTGTTPDGGRLVALVSVREDSSFVCFEGGARSCAAK